MIRACATSLPRNARWFKAADVRQQSGCFDIMKPKIVIARHRSEFCTPRTSGVAVVIAEDVFRNEIQATG
jgi:hypothetical protein